MQPLPEPWVVFRPVPVATEPPPRRWWLEQRRSHRIGSVREPAADPREGISVAAAMAPAASTDTGNGRDPRSADERQFAWLLNDCRPSADDDRFSNPSPKACVTIGC